MQIMMPLEVAKRLANELKKAGHREIGGLLLGEHIGGDTFKVVEITVQTERGTSSHFERDPESHKQQLDAFFERTGEEHSRFNYFGEWHSHPSFPPVPSTKDLESMDSILGDPAVGANFLVLLIVRLMRESGLTMSATICTKGACISSAAIFTEVEAISIAPRRRLRPL